MPLDQSTKNALKKIIDSQLNRLAKYGDIFTFLCSVSNIASIIPELATDKAGCISLTPADNNLVKQIQEELDSLFASPQEQLKQNGVFVNKTVMDNELKAEMGEIIRDFLLAVKSPLFLACKNGNKKYFENLLNRNQKIDLNSTKLFDRLKDVFEKQYYNSHIKKSPLVIAAQYNQIELVEFLIQKGARLTNEVLAVAVRNQNQRLIEILIKKGCDPVAVTPGNGKSILEYAIYNCPVSIVEILLRSEKVTPDIINGLQLIHLAILYNKAVLLPLLITKGGNINAKGEGSEFQGRSPLHYAFTKNNLEAVGILFKAKAELNVISNANTSALHSAASKGHVAWLEKMAEQAPDMLIQCDRNSNIPFDQLFMTKTIDDEVKYNSIIKILSSLAKNNNQDVINEIFANLIKQEKIEQFYEVLSRQNDIILIQVLLIADLTARIKPNLDVEVRKKSLESSLIVKLIETDAVVLTEKDNSDKSLIDIVLDFIQLNKDSRALNGFKELLILKATLRANTDVVRTLLDGCLLRELTLDSTNTSLGKALFYTIAEQEQEGSIGHLLLNATDKEKAQKDYQEKKIEQLLPSKPTDKSIKGLVEIIAKKMIEYNQILNNISPQDLKRCQSYISILVNDKSTNLDILLNLRKAIEQYASKVDKESKQYKDPFLNDIANKVDMLIHQKLLDILLEKPTKKTLKDIFTNIAENKIKFGIHEFKMTEAQANAAIEYIQAKLPAILTGAPEILENFIDMLSEFGHSIQTMIGKPIIIEALEKYKTEKLKALELNGQYTFEQNWTNIQQLFVLLDSGKLTISSKQVISLLPSDIDKIKSNIKQIAPSILAPNVQDNNDFTAVMTRLDELGNVFAKLKNKAKHIELVKEIVLSTYLLTAKRENADLTKIAAILGSGTIQLGSEKIEIANDQAFTEALKLCLEQCEQNHFSYSPKILFDTASELTKHGGAAYQDLAKAYYQKASIRAKEVIAVPLKKAHREIKEETSKTKNLLPAVQNKIRQTGYNSVVRERQVADKVIEDANKKLEITRTAENKQANEIHAINMYIMKQVDTFEHPKSNVKERKQAFASLKKLAEQNNLAAMRMLADIYRENKDPNKSWFKNDQMKKAINLYTELANKKDAYGEFWLKHIAYAQEKPDSIEKYTKAQDVLNSAFKFALLTANPIEKLRVKQFIYECTNSTYSEIAWYAKTLQAMLSSDENMILCQLGWASLNNKDEKKFKSVCGEAIYTARQFLYRNQREHYPISDVMLAYINQYSKENVIGSDAVKKQWEDIKAEHDPQLKAERERLEKERQQKVEEAKAQLEKLSSFAKKLEAVPGSDQQSGNEKLGTMDEDEELQKLAESMSDESTPSNQATWQKNASSSSSSQAELASLHGLLRAPTPPSDDPNMAEEAQQKKDNGKKLVAG